MLFMKQTWMLHQHPRKRPNKFNMLCLSSLVSLAAADGALFIIALRRRFEQEQVKNHWQSQGFSGGY